MSPNETKLVKLASRCCSQRTFAATCFIQTLLRDLKEFQTLSKYSLRRLILIEMQKNISQKDLKRFQNIINNLRRSLGDDYLERIEQRLKEFRSEIIIAIENISQTS